MSSVRGAGFRGGRGRGSGGLDALSTAPRGPSNNRGRGDNNAARRGNNALRGVTGRGTTTFIPRGRGGVRGASATAQPPTFAPKAIGGIPAPTGDWAARQKQLISNREQEKKDAIAQGLMSDPDKAIALSQAITLVGTCQDMCPENERVTRAMRNELWDPEKDENGQADESRMVKRFKRSAAGDEVQLPSDLRPPHVLKRVCDYLFHELIEDDDSLAKNHHFVWDRTRGVRNDFSVQQISKLEDLRIAIDCFERIARFHIISLHLLAKQPKPYETYSEQQDREQLDRTLLSLLQYYDDVRGRLDLPNEPEFRAYCVIFQLRDPTPDLEDRVQSWPRTVSGDPRVQVAMEIYSAAQSTMYPEGPMDTAKHVVARQNWERFWALVMSKKVSYLMGCVAEVYFNLLRHVMLNAIIRTARKARPPKLGEQLPPNTDFKLEDLWYQFNFDHEDELKEFVGRWGLKFETGPDGVEFLDIRQFAGRNLPEPRKEGPKQLKSEIVEVKRHFRTIPAVIDGLSVRQAKEAGMIGLVEEDHEITIADGDGENDEMRKEDEEDEESLFLSPEKITNELFAPKTTEATKPLSAFGQPNSNPFVQTGFSFGKPSAGSASPFGAPSTAPASNPFAKPLEPPAEKKDEPKNPFSFLSAPEEKKEESSSPFSLLNAPRDKTEEPKNPFGSFSAPQQEKGEPKNPFSFLNAPTTTVEGPAKTPTANPFAFPSTTTATPSAPATESSPKSTVFGSPTIGSGSANPFLSSFAPKDEAAPKKEAIKTPPKKLSGPFIDDDSPENSPSKSEAEKIITSAPSACSFPKTSDKPASTFGQSNDQPEAGTNSKSAQPQASSPTTNASPANSSSQNSAIPNSVGQSNSRRPSLSSPIGGVDHHKPKKPSPLSNSFTASGDAAAPPAPTTPLAPDFETILTRLAKEMTFAPSRGILKEFVEFAVKHAIEDIHARLRHEREIELREDYLGRKYLGRWRDIAPVLGHRRRLAEKGRAARERTQRRLAESLRSEASSPHSRHSRKEMFNSAFRSTRREKAAEETQAKAGSKRLAVAEGMNSVAATNGTGHKRSRTADDRDRGRSTSLVTSSDAQKLKQSSFLGFSLAAGAPYRASTTKSTYFRMKALGIPTTETQHRGTKRPRAGSDVASAVPATRLKSSSPLEQARDSESMPQPSTRSVRSRTNDEDDALFVRLRAARDALKEGEDFMKDAVEKDEVFRRSLNSSQSSNESPSMARARAEARLRASQGPSDLGASIGARDVPAYRLRQSRFLSAEEQARAVERAHEIRASRGSRESSRPASRMEEPVETIAPSSKLKAPPTSQPSASPSKESSQPTTIIANGEVKSPAKQPTAPTGFDPAFRKALPSQPPASFNPQVPPAAAAARNPFTQSSSFAPPRANGNPFLQATSNGYSGSSPRQAKLFMNGFNSRKNTQPASQTASQESHDNTIPRSQIPDALSHTFGRSKPASQPSPFMPSRAASGVIDLVSDDEDEEADLGDSDPMAYGQQYYGNDMGLNDSMPFTTNGVGPTSFDQSADDDLHGDSAYTSNSFGLLANDVNEDEEEAEEQWDESGDGEPGVDAHGRQIPDSYQYSTDEEAADNASNYDDYEMPNSHGYDEGSAESADGEDEDEGDGLMEDADEEDEDGFDEDQEEEYDSGEDDGAFFNGPPLNHAYNQHAQHGPKNPALQDVGANAEEAIELSD